MTIKDTIKEIDAILKRSPYTRQEIALFWEAQDEKNWELETLVALAISYEYLKRQGKPEAEFLRGKYETMLGKLKESYGVVTERPNHLPSLRSHD